MGTKKKITRTKKSTAKKTSAIARVTGALDAIKAIDVHPPPIPVDRLVAEGLALDVTARRHVMELRKTGVDRAHLEGIAVRAQALAEAQASLTNARGSKRSTKERALEADATELRAEMVADGRYALRDDAGAQATLDRIQAGDGLDDLVQDLRALVEFFGVHAVALRRASPAKKAARAASAADALERVIADRRSSDTAEATAVVLRDRAATYLFQAMTEVRAAGAYVFRKRPEILAKFRSAYNTVHRARAKKPVAAAASPPNGGITSP